MDISDTGMGGVHGSIKCWNGLGIGRMTGWFRWGDDLFGVDGVEGGCLTGVFFFPFRGMMDYYLL